MKRNVTMKNFFSEFKTFITRGNVIDLSVGVIVGSAFTAIVNGLSTNILKPLINVILALIFGAEGLSDIYTMLKPAYLEDGTIDLANSIYIDWGAFLNAVINFFIVAFVLFTIVRIVNRFREERREFTEKMLAGIPSRADRKMMKAKGIRLSDRAAVAAYYAEERRIREEEAARKAEEDKAAAALERENNPTAEDLLKEIRDLLKGAQK